jgi:FKBP-type peptidyl-prolyl cis-trans isomerase
MKRTIVTLLALLFLSAAGVVAQSNKAVQLKSDVDTLSYALGSDFGLSLHKITNTLEDDIDLELFFRGVNDYLEGKCALGQRTVRNYLQTYINEVNPQKALVNANEYLENIAKQEGVKRTASGLLYEIVIPGNRNKRAVLDTDLVRINYEGKLRNGTVFDSTFDRNESEQFALNQRIKGFAEGIKLIGEGGVIKLWIPPHLGYGRHGIYGGIVGPNQALAYTITLISVTPTPEPEPEVVEEASQSEVTTEPAAEEHHQEEPTPEEVATAPTTEEQSAPATTEE